MAKRVDAERRKREIALKAMKLFAEVGYADVSLLAIAYEAKLARTVIYRCFRNKREVMDAAIRANTQYIVEESRRMLRGGGTAARRLARVGERITEILFDRRDFLTAVFDFVLAMVREGEDIRERFMMFTSVTRGMFHGLIEEGVSTGDFRADTDVDSLEDGLFSLLESTAMRIILGLETSSRTACRRFADTIASLAHSENPMS